MQDTAVNTNANVAFNYNNFAATNSDSVAASDILDNPASMAYLRNRAAEYTGDFVSRTIGGSSDPEAINTARGDILASALDDSREYIGATVPDDHADFIDEFIERSMAWMNSEANEETREAGGGAQGGEGAGKKGKNWLVAVMEALSKNAGDHLARTVEIADEIGNLESTTEDLHDLSTMEDGPEKDKLREENEATASRNTTTRAEEARKMTQLQGEMQAEMQLFKMAFEAAASIGKTVGQGFQSMARAQ